MVKSGCSHVKRQDQTEATLLSKDDKVTLLAMDEDDKDELASDDENVISASDEEDDSDIERKHNKLLDAICSLRGKKRKKQTERSEASLQVSEFSVNAEGAGEKINLSDLLVSIEKTPGALNKTKKQLRCLQNNKGTLELPLSKQQTEKIQRGVAYERSSREISRWESIIKQNQKAEQLFFPLNQEPSGPKRVEQVVTGWKAQTPLEQQIFSLLHSNKQPINDPVLTPVEEASIRAMSLEEANIRRAELQKARALQSYYESKARRERKIKSKMFHKVQKKVKRKEFLKQFEEMRKTDPDGALEELKKMELSRMEERMSLKHQNSGKWAKTKAIMAKYDDSARKAMQEQLELNKQLTLKLTVPSDDEEGEEVEGGLLPDFVNDADLTSDPANPWMRGKLAHEVIVTEDQEVTNNSADEKTEQESIRNQEEEVEEEENEEEQLLRQFERKRKLREKEPDDLVPVFEEKKQTEIEKEISKEEEASMTQESDDEEEEEDEAEVVSEFNSLFNRLMKTGRPDVGQERRQTHGEGFATQDEELLNEGLVHARTMEDLENLEDEAAEPSQSSKDSAPHDASGDPAPEPSKKKLKKDIDLKEVLTKKANMIKMSLMPTMVDDEEEVDEEQSHAEQISIIKEAFAGDDVVSDFLKDKKKQEAAGKPKVVDLTLPGWGEWGGGGLKPCRNKRRKFRLKPPPAPPRKDQKLPAVIISEKRNSSIALHQVSNLPYPFQNSTQFESSIRFPIGQTWNTQNTVRKITAPKVVTKLGTVIEPMRKEDFLTDEKNAAVRQKRGDLILKDRDRKSKTKGVADRKPCHKNKMKKTKGKE